MDHPHPKKEHPLRFIILVALCLLLAGMFYSSNRRLQVEETVFSSPQLPESFDGFTIVQLSDVHGAVFGEDNEELIEKVAARQPDLIVITGDLVDENCAYDAERSLTAALPAIAPTYYITGNHEWAAGAAEPLMALLTEQGVTCLRNAHVRLERNDESIVLAGVEDPNGYADQKTPQEVAEEVYRQEGDPFWILLAHRNNLYREYSQLGADLLLTGHGHGGVIRLPFTDGLVGVERDFFPTWTSGLYEDFETPMFVSRGIGNIGRTFRFNNPPQIAVITLKKEG